MYVVDFDVTGTLKLACLKLTCIVIMFSAKTTGFLQQPVATEGIWL